MSPAKSYITTPIYYWNGIPHVGHYYSSLIANTFYLYDRISWKDTRFTTWIDENSQKAVLKAEEAGMEIMDYLDDMATKHQTVWDHFGFGYTDFIRTTEPRHHDVVQKVLQKCFDRWDIYQWEYEWKYCVGCEAFKKDDDLIPHPDPLLKGEGDKKNLVCPDHLTVPDQIKEKNYFFKLSKYQTWIEEFYAAHPEFVVPSFRYNEVKAFVGRWLEDFSISRETNTFGITLPFDGTQVTYVWFDALFNYYTSLVSSRGWDKANTDFTDESDFWLSSQDGDTKKLHVVGKDIIRFHAIFWPAMLASYFDGWEERDGVLHFHPDDTKFLPDTILTGGHFTVDGQKMSKTIWNVIEPVAYSKEYSWDLLALYMLSAFPIWNDWDYDRQQAILTYNAKLANNLWNLVNRIVVLSLKLEHNLWEGIEEFTHLSWEDYESEMNQLFPESAPAILQAYSYFEAIEQCMQNYDLKWALDNIFILLDGLNKFADSEAPWTLLKTDPKKAEIILYIIGRRLVLLGMALYPFFPAKMVEMFAKLWLQSYGQALLDGDISGLDTNTPAFNITQKWENLFDRIEV